MGALSSRMITPVVSVILPVYNSGRYIAAAIDSILTQSLSNFELIIINDGSTDNSETIILSYTDPRIVYISNDGNKGLIFSLNKGIEIAKGKYIARMDADDICMPERLALQKQWLDEHEETSVVGCNIQFINDHNEPAGSWQLDLATITNAAIKRTLPKENCMAHPSVMGRAAIFKQYRYAPYQQNIEDYDLWLRLAADGNTIEKINKVLLLYRVHVQSVTTLHLRKANTFLKLYTCKKKFVWRRIRLGRFNLFDARVMAWMLLDLARAPLKSIKRRLYKNK